MRKTIHLLLAMTVFAVVFVSACSPAPAPATQAALPPVEVAPTEAVVVPTQPPPAATVQTFAPACQTSASCETPAVKDTAANETYCVQKIPYQNILVENGVAFESLDSSTLICADNGTVVDGKHVIECHGTQLWTTELKLTNTACSGTALVTGASQCQAGLGYDAAQNCCAPLVPTDTGSVTIKINMGACP